MSKADEIKNLLECVVLCATEEAREHFAEQLEAAIDEMQAEIDRLRVAQPKTAPVLLTDAEVLSALLGSDLEVDKFARAVEAAVLKKNGFKLT